MTYHLRSYLKLLIPLLMLGAFASSCYTSAGSRRGDASSKLSALLQLAVSPEHAEVYIDEEYSGKIAKWRDGVIPVSPGDHRIQIRADGHISERFDLHLNAREMLTLTVNLEPELTLPNDITPE